MLSKEFGAQKGAGRILPTIDLHSKLVNYAGKNLSLGILFHKKLPTTRDSRDHSLLWTSVLRCQNFRLENQKIP